ncbi:sugar phosphorylase [Acaryochloris sp. CCMEE 5410]|uniref:sugar phosphorylase n=1 Tax=Acaryochloris sp. CCMEE 5410 TaxID=310037 RepID=UPI000314B0B3|nr:sugar phosphorylase [Acaryochloris sp. CCMEE 5410]KAI9135268.1 sugar phosphorylase [Acaryochloris sp. CCMEE 5410]
MIDRAQQHQAFTIKVKALLERIYGPDSLEPLLEKLFELLQPHFADSISENLYKWSQDNILLITYGDTICSQNGHPPLGTLHHFLKTHLQEVVTGVHILPFCPFSSDDGFSVIDYKAVNHELGTWDDIQQIAQSFELMADLVLNHVSSQSQWFQNYLRGIEPGRDYFVEVDPETDVSSVVRPRSSPLLVEVETLAGPKYVWATFSADQIDLNFANPKVLLEFTKILLFYVQMGAKYIRLDAIGYLWKRLGTSCIHLPETHAMVRLFREILEMVDPSVALITETNVPNRENLSYFGNRNEAHLIYNFSLPPLILNALLQGKAEHLKTWMMSMPPAPLGCAYFNFTASHDGIGLRPTEGLLTETEYQTLLQCMEDFGGTLSMRTNAEGIDSPYEINISFFDALQGTAKGKDQWQIERFICSQTIMMSLEGIPAFYIHSLLATHNDWENVHRTGRKRSINRHQWSLPALEQQLEDEQSPHAIVLKELTRLIKIRRQQDAFHPNATQYTLHLPNKALFAFWRQSMARDQSIFSIHNLSDRKQKLKLSDLNLVTIDPWYDLISGSCIRGIYDTLLLNPYQSLWITNKFEGLEADGQTCHLGVEGDDD